MSVPKKSRANGIECGSAPICQKRSTNVLKNKNWCWWGLPIRKCVGINFPNVFERVDFLFVWEFGIICSETRHALKCHLDTKASVHHPWLRLVIFSVICHTITTLTCFQQARKRIISTNLSYHKCHIQHYLVDSSQRAPPIISTPHRHCVRNSKSFTSCLKLDISIFLIL